MVQYPLINKKKLTGTARYASINALKGYEQSRRDDLEAVGYVLMYFLRGSLPWQGLAGKNKEERYKRILKKKIDTSPYDLCVGFPEEFEKYIEYTRKMEYVEQPLYDNLRGYFLHILEKENEDFDFIYDWSTEEEKNLRRKEYLEEINNKKNRKNSSLAEEIILTTRNGQDNKIHVSEINDDEEEEIKENNNNLHNINININKIEKYLDEEIIHKSKTKELKENYKFATKESSLEGNNNYKHFNTNNFINGRRNSRQRSNSRRRSGKENEDSKNKEKEEVCCSEACNIF